jgi:hypothetical protein
MLEKIADYFNVGLNCLIGRKLENSRSLSENPARAGGGYERTAEGYSGRSEKKTKEKRMATMVSRDEIMVNTSTPYIFRALRRHCRPR